jgi:hypothetical protein
MGAKRYAEWARHSCRTDFAQSSDGSNFSGLYCYLDYNPLSTGPESVKNFL